jgi:hypothetical protein
VRSRREKLLLLANATEGMLVVHVSKGNFLRVFWHDPSPRE